MIAPAEMHSFLGVKVVVFEDTPKFQISADCPLSDDFRKEMNEWCLTFFGTHNALEDGSVIKVGDKIYLNPRTLDHFKTVSRCAPKI